MGFSGRRQNPAGPFFRFFSFSLSLTAACATRASSSHSNAHPPESGERSILRGRALETKMKLGGGEGGGVLAQFCKKLRQRLA